MKLMHPGCWKVMRVYRRGFESDTDAFGMLESDAAILKTPCQWYSCILDAGR